MTLLLLFQSLLEFLNELFEATQTLYFRLVLLRQLLHELRAQPVVGNHRFDDIVQGFKVLKMEPECSVEAVIVLFVFDKNGARQGVEIIHVTKGQPLLHRLEQIQQLAGRHRHAGVLQHMEEVDEHGLSALLGDA